MQNLFEKVKTCNIPCQGSIFLFFLFFFVPMYPFFFLAPFSLLIFFLSAMFVEVHLSGWD